MVKPALDLPMDRLRDFCARWKIRRLELFGSALGAAFSVRSDVDLLVTFAPDAKWNLWDHMGMEMELEAILGRDVDVLTRRSVEQSRNPYRKREILNSARTIYAA